MLHVWVSCIFPLLIELSFHNRLVGEDCCVHCILACLFCEFLTLCNMVVAQASCGACTSEACCCCCCADDLGDDCNCPCDMDCGIMDACCESSDCLEICMECCGICFPTWKLRLPVDSTRRQRHPVCGSTCVPVGVVFESMHVCTHTQVKKKMQAWPPSSCTSRCFYHF